LVLPLFYEHRNPSEKLYLQSCSSSVITEDHTMAWVEKDHNALQFHPPAMCRVANQQPRLPRATSSLALNACRDGASTASLGKNGYLN